MIFLFSETILGTRLVEVPSNHDLVEDHLGESQNLPLDGFESVFYVGF